MNILNEENHSPPQKRKESKKTNTRYSISLAYYVLVPAKYHKPHLKFCVFGWLTPECLWGEWGGRERT